MPYLGALLALIVASQHVMISFEFICWPPSKSDNTVRENKNNGVLKMMSALLAKHKMDMLSCLYPRVGHSHGSLGVLPKMTAVLNPRHVFRVGHSPLRSVLWIGIQCSSLR